MIISQLVLYVNNMLILEHGKPGNFAEKIDFLQKVWDTVLGPSEEGPGRCTFGRRFTTPPKREVMVMPITLTVHIGKFTITITVKSGNRHSGK